MSYTELGLALTAFNVVSAVVQTPAGFLVDRVERPPRPDRRIADRRSRLRGRRPRSFVLGIRRDVRARRPRQHRLSPGRLRIAVDAMCQRSASGACSRTTRSPAWSAMPPRRRRCVYLHTMIGWRGAFLVAAAFGVIAALILALQNDPPRDATAKPIVEAGAPKLRRLNATAGSSCSRRRSSPISCSSSCCRCRAAASTTTLWSTLGALHGTPVAVANMALTGLLAMSAVGVLVGGILTGWTPRHGLIATAGLSVTAPSACSSG